MARDRDRLSPREEAVLHLAAEGLTDAGIAHKLGISETSVATYWSRVRMKRGGSSRTEMVAGVVKEWAEREIAALKEQISAMRARVGGSLPALFEAAPEALLAVDQTGRIRAANAMADELFGYPEGGLLNRALRELVPPELRERHIAHVGQYMARPERRNMGEHMATVAIRADGTQFTIAATLNGMEGPDGVWAVCAVRAVTPGTVAA